MPDALGAVAASVNFAAPFDAPETNPALSVTLQVNSAPGLLSGEQLTEETPVLAVAPVAETPDGNWSLTLADVPVVEVPLLPRFNV